MVKDVVSIDEKNGVTLWWDAMQKEMENEKVTFQTIPESEKPPNEFKRVNSHMDFDIKWRIP